MSGQHRLADARGHLEQRYRRLEQSRSVGPVIAVLERFKEEEGGPARRHAVSRVPH